MIMDRLANWKLYRGANPLWTRGLQFLEETDLASLPLGRHDLDGDHLFALVQEYETKADSACRWEAHRKYCDIQFVARGCERIGVANLAQMQVTQPYDAERDVAFFEGRGDMVTVPAGTFLIFAPEDVHMPCLSAQGPEVVRKIVLKAALKGS